jgi:pimeloyl-ACP methyl ester carboxylesterase
VKQETRLIQKQMDLGICKISYLEGGAVSESPPILFLHGWGIAANPYHEILDILAQRYQVIAPDLPNFAGSSYPGIVESYGQYAELLLAFLKALKLDRVHLIGHSLGGGIAVTIATFSPQKVASLTVVDGTGIPIGSVVEVLFRRAIEMPLQLSPDKWYLQFVEIPQVFVPNLIFNTQNVIQALLLSLEKDLRSLFSLVKAPCLLLWSEKDLTTPLSAGEEFHHRITGSKLVVVQEGYHEWSLLYPEKFTALILDFVQTVDAAKQLV